jgi:actin beta/gamma 1
MSFNVDTDPLVVDTGSSMCKTGFGGDDAPRSVFPTVIGRPRYTNAMCGSRPKTHFIGDEAQMKRGILSLTWPIQNGAIKDWNDVEKIWDFAFNQEMRVDTDTRWILLTESPLNSRSNREKSAELMFEKYKTLGLYIAIQAVLSMFAAGRTSGIVCQMGDGSSHTVGVYEGYAIPHATTRVGLCGRDLTAYLNQLLNSNGCSFGSSAERDLVNEMKEKVCYIAEDFAEEEQKAFSSEDIIHNYTLPDGNVIKINDERFRCPEALFNPQILGYQHFGIHEHIYNTIQQCEIDLRLDFSRNIVLSGGNTMFKGFKTRLGREINAIIEGNNRRKHGVGRVREVSIYDPPERKYSAWIGGSILSSLSTFSRIVIPKSKYDECGPGVIHRNDGVM